MDKNLSKNEWLIMETLWAQEGMFLADIREYMSDAVSWKHTTFLTYLKKLTVSGFISYELINGDRCYRAVISRGECVDTESDNLRSKLSDQSTKLLLANLIREGSLKKNEYDELKALIDKMESEVD